LNIPVSITASEHYTWGDGCDGWHLVRSDGLSVIQERMPPGAQEVRHSHAKARQFFYVLAGRLHLEVGGTSHAIDAGVGLEIAPGTPHQVFNRGVQDAEFLVVSQPPSHGDRDVVPELGP
jgi:mannose-6-phosphate isomerase-like protein (cupin superfamily)